MGVANFMNYIPFKGIIQLKNNSTSLPEIAYLFKLKGDVSHTYANKNIWQPWSSVKRIYMGKHDRQTIKRLR